MFVFDYAHSKIIEITLSFPDIVQYGLGDFEKLHRASNNLQKIKWS